MTLNRPCFPHRDRVSYSIVQVLSIINMNTSLHFPLDFKSEKLLQEYEKLLDKGRFQAQAVINGAARVRSNACTKL